MKFHFFRRIADFQPAIPENRPSFRMTVIPALILAALTISLYAPVIGHGFTNWDDDDFLLYNFPVRHLSVSNIAGIMTDVRHGSYVPLTLLSFAVEHHFFGLEPLVYHLTNVLLHAANVVLILFLVTRLTGSLSVGGWAALIFAVHPMHVESVAWITERKDVLYSFFYLLAMLDYGSWKRSGNKVQFLRSLFWGILSMLAKPMALSLPLVLVLMDWAEGRKIHRSDILEKGWYALYIIPILWLTYRVHARIPGEETVSSVLLWLWTGVFYLRTFLFPLHLSPLYAIPEPFQFSNPAVWTHLAGLGLIGWAFLKGGQWLRWALLYYLVSIFFLLKFDTHDPNIVADRYMYLPSLGICLWLGVVIDRLLRRHRRVVLFGVMILFFGWSFTAGRMMMIWENSDTLWTYTLSHPTNRAIALNNRGKHFYQTGRLDQALRDFQNVLQARPDHSLAVHNIGLVYAAQGRREDALRMYNQAIALQDRILYFHENRGVLYMNMGRYDAALADFSRAIELGPWRPAAFVHRANLLVSSGYYAAAEEDYSRALERFPSDAKLYVNRGFVRERLGQRDEAREDYQHALRLGLKDAEGYLHRMNEQK